MAYYKYNSEAKAIEVINTLADFLKGLNISFDKEIHIAELECFGICKIGDNTIIIESLPIDASDMYESIDPQSFGL